MNSKILDRYEITSDNRFIIDVNIPEPDELFETYDENASFYKKDLNPRFEGYLLDCVQEIGLKNKFIIRIGLPKVQAEKTDEGEILYGFKQYFEYCILICKKEIKTISMRMLLHLGLACSVLVLLMVFHFANSGATASFTGLLMTGLSAAVWVLLLTGFSRFLFRTLSQRSDIKIYRALKNSPVNFVFRGVEA